MFGREEAYTESDCSLYNNKEYTLKQYFNLTYGIKKQKPWHDVLNRQKGKMMKCVNIA